MGTKELKIQLINSSFNKLKETSQQLNQIQCEQIDQFPWETPESKPAVLFKIAHNNKEIILQYNVSENEMLARYSKPNDPVYTDSCVEFFIQFEGDNNYYNLEFNCFGNCLSAYGPDRHSREPLPASQIKTIQTYTEIQRCVRDYQFKWMLTVAIPIEIFIHNKINQLSGTNAKANFYKCGDDLSEPHYVSWNNIGTPEPDFHQSKFFGKLHFL